jgi:hypothetical protein
LLTNGRMLRPESACRGAEKGLIYHVQAEILRFLSLTPDLV